MNRCRNSSGLCWNISKHCFEIVTRSRLESTGADVLWALFNSALISALNLSYVDVWSLQKTRFFFILQKIQRLLALYWRSCWAHENRNGVARRSPSERFPRNCYVEGTRSRKCEFLCFPNFIKNKSRARTNVFTADTERILAVARRWPSTRRVACRRWKQVCFVAKIWYYFFRLRVTHAFSNRHLVDSSIFHRCD